MHSHRDDGNEREMGTSYSHRDDGNECEKSSATLQRASTPLVPMLRMGIALLMPSCGSECGSSLLFLLLYCCWGLVCIPIGTMGTSDRDDGNERVLGFSMHSHRDDGNEREGLLGFLRINNINNSYSFCFTHSIIWVSYFICKTIISTISRRFSYFISKLITIPDKSSMSRV